MKYSAAMVNKCRRGPDGKTAYELGPSSREHCRISAVKILFMIHGVTRGVARV